MKWIKVSIENSKGITHPPLCPTCLSKNPTKWFEAKCTLEVNSKGQSLLTKTLLSFDWPCCQKCIVYERWTFWIFIFSAIVWVIGFAAFSSILCESYLLSLRKVFTHNMSTVLIVVFVIIYSLVLRFALKYEAKKRNRSSIQRGVFLENFTAPDQQGRRSFTFVFSNPYYASEFIKINGGDAVCRYDRDILQNMLAAQTSTNA